MRKFIFDNKECTQYSDKEILAMIDMILTGNLEVTYHGKRFAREGIESIIRESEYKIRNLQASIVKMEKLARELENITER